ncbi:octanoyltransferase [Candidatus Photodesmus katoptron]|nr:octanoyltransferase [Candidatus Photodesmus katoptron]
MREFTDKRTNKDLDELWLLEHYPVFTQGQSDTTKQVFNNINIPLIKSDRGGKITYHGPGQLIVYFLIDLHRKKISVRDFVTCIEKLVINTLKKYNIDSISQPNAPGVYVNNKKICSIGLRIRKGCSFHGLALNVNMDLSPFLYIDPCGYHDMEMVQISQLGGPKQLNHIEQEIIKEFIILFNYKDIIYIKDINLSTYTNRYFSL